MTHLLLILSKQFHYLGIESSNTGAEGTILIQTITHNAYRWLDQSDWILWNKESQSDGKEDLFHDNRDCHSFCPCFSLRYSPHPLPETGVLLMSWISKILLKMYLLLFIYLLGYIEVDFAPCPAVMTWIRSISHRLFWLLSFQAMGLFQEFMELLGAGFYLTKVSGSLKTNNWSLVPTHLVPLAMNYCAQLS